MLFYVEYTFNIIFTIEMLIKMLAIGVIHAKHSYLRDPWNVLDFAVVAGGWASVFLEDTVLPQYVPCALCECCAQSILWRMKVLVISLLESLPALSDVVMLLLFIFFVFGIVGVGFLKAASDLLHQSPEQF